LPERLASALVLLDPTVARFFIPVYGIEKPMWFHIIFGLIYVILFTLIMFDRAHGRNYKPYVVAICGFLVYEIVFHIIYIL
jgi:hypothetical protein